MKKIILILLGFSVSLMDAQVGNENVSYSPGTFFMRANRPTTKEYVIEGSPYINSDKFEKVIIKDYGKNVQALRYNAYEDEMEFKEGGELYYANRINYITIQFPTLNKTYRFLSYTYDGKPKAGYLVLLVDNSKYSLYKKEQIELLKGEKSANAYTKDANDYYSKDRDLYLISKNNQYYKFPKNANEIIRLFSMDKMRLENFIKANKIVFSKEEDLIRLVEFMNQY